MIGKIKKIFTSRLVVTGALIILQCILLFYEVLKLSTVFIYMNFILYFLSLLMVVYLVNEGDKSPSIKMPWIILILIVPLVGGVAYLLFGRNAVEVEAIRRRNTVEKKLKEYYGNNELEEELRMQSEPLATQSHYIHKVADCSLQKNTQSEYLPLGEVMFEKTIEILQKAQKFIFIEFFIIEEGVMWDTILEILKKKVAEGVEVRVIYDDIGCIRTLPNNYEKTLRSYGIKCSVFNPFKPVLSIIHNNRNHRKIIVVDGIYGINGGINLADEYINKKERFGHWKDSALYLYGEGVRNLTLIFLEDWYYCNNPLEDYSLFMPQTLSIESDGYVQSYGDSPLDANLTGQNVYMNVLGMATKYVYITTPYFIIDYEFLNAIKQAALRGVDIRIITPHIPDKWYVHIITRSYYQTLIESGVKVYEYKPGFIHAKTMVCDDTIGICGTINLDYRSLVHHYECATILYQSKTVLAMKDDFSKTLEKCINAENLNKRKHKMLYDIIMNIVKLFASLM